MNNLNKKIGIVVLSGLALVGSGFVSHSSAYYEYKRDQYARSEYESGPLARRRSSEEDRNKVRNYGKYSDIERYDILLVDGNYNNRAIRRLENKYHVKLSKPFKSFINVEKFFNHVGHIGLPKGIHSVNIKGSLYVLDVH